MTSVLRRQSIRLRLIAGFSATAITLLLVVIVGASGFSSVSDHSRTSHDSLLLAKQALDAKYLAADWNGWQTAYAFAANLDNTSLDAPAGARASFTASAQALDTALTGLSTASGLTAPEQAQVDVARQGFTAFMALDQKIVSDFQRATPAGVQAANQLVLVDEIKAYQGVATAMTVLSKSIAGRSEKASKSTASTATDGRRTLLIISILALLAMAVCVPILVTSVTGPLRRLEERLRDISEGEGDLTARLEVTGNDELTGTAVAFNSFVEQIGTVIAGCRGVGHHRRGGGGADLRDLAADRHLGRGGLRPGRHRGQRLLRGHAQRADRRLGGRGDGRVDPRDRAERQRSGQRGLAGGAGDGGDERDGAEARRVLGRDQQRHQDHHLHRRADQPARPERHHRGGPGR
jgi:methyl-accepting chemotaxis protein